ncbi:MAG: two-component sensor histidine kinase [Epsilonproteobacteria bacterium]|nr:two-component sensor histidine kinase [Campylobacterota bacterium]
MKNRILSIVRYLLQYKEQFLNDETRYRFEIVNVILLLSLFGLAFGIIGNIIRGTEGFVIVETSLLLSGIAMLIALRSYPKSFSLVVALLSVEYTLFYIFLLYTSHPADMKHLWLFTYPIIIMNLQPCRRALFWLLLLITAIAAAPFQNFVEVDFTPYQVLYLGVVITLVSIITVFYKRVMTKAHEKILEQQNRLRDFNAKLEQLVDEKTAELSELNSRLEEKVQQKVEELLQKDEILTKQSRQAVMGEMIAMIAHQWRQPLSSVTLQISSLQIGKMLNGRMDEEEVERSLSQINETIMYLSETIEDFKRYFQPDKKEAEVDIADAIRRALNFTMPRLRTKSIDVLFDETQTYIIHTHLNELIQVILNILNNAIDVLEERMIEAPKIFIELERIGGEIKISIEDNAGGIADEALTKIFEPYFSTKGKNGTGLGLYMSQMIAQKQLRGSIEATNTQKGARFCVTIGDAAL